MRRLLCVILVGLCCAGCTSEPPSPIHVYIDVIVDGNPPPSFEQNLVTTGERVVANLSGACLLEEHSRIVAPIDTLTVFAVPIDDKWDILIASPRGDAGVTVGVDSYVGMSQTVAEVIASLYPDRANATPLTVGEPDYRNYLALRVASVEGLLDDKWETRTLDKAMDMRLRSPDFVEAYLWESELILNRPPGERGGDVDRAQESARQALDRWPYDVRAQILWARAARARGNDAEADKRFEPLVERCGGLNLNP